MAPIRILDRTTDTVIIGLGVRGGVKVGDDLVIWREIAGKKVKVGTVKVVRVYPTDSEGTIIMETGTIKAGDTSFLYSNPLHGCTFK